MSPYATAGGLHRFRNKFIGDRAFYRAVLALVVPVILQNTVSNLVGLLNNIMVGQLGTVEMSGVAISNQLIFVFNLTIFGGLSGPGIFGAQFFGAGNTEGLRQTFRFKLYIAGVLLATTVILFLTRGGPLISLYLTGPGSPGEAQAIHLAGEKYLKIMLLGLLPFALSQVYGGTLRETGETMLPMVASLVAVLTNVTLNFILIFGRLGFPALGITGAAIATVISRYVELFVILIIAYRRTERFQFLKGLFRSFRIPLPLLKAIAIKGLPLLANEMLWSMSMTVLMQIFSTRDMNVNACMDVAGVVTQLFNAVLMAMGVAVAVMIGQALGSGDTAKAKAMVWKLAFLAFCSSIIIGGTLASVSGLIPLAYNTTDHVRRLATLFMLTSAVLMPFNSLTFCSYFAIRAGGKTIITFLFDSAFSWVVFIPYAYVLTHYTPLSIFVIYPLSYISEAVKCVIGLLILRTGYWAQNVVSGHKTPELVTEPSE